MLTHLFVSPPQGVLTSVISIAFCCHDDGVAPRKVDPLTNARAAVKPNLQPVSWLPHIFVVIAT